jgi:hypothetical protein
MKQPCKLRVSFQCSVGTFFLFVLCLQPVLAQDAAQKPVEKLPEKSAEKTAIPEKAVNPAEIELLETKVRFESNGDSRKEVHALVKINSELGVRQFAKLNFDYNRSFESIEIPLVHITHASGGTADILPSAITDQPNPAVVNAPAYQDVRVKSVRILGLEPGDTLEYRVITTVSHHPLAPDFWFDHAFDRTGVVSREIFELDLPLSRFAASEAERAFPPTSDDPASLLIPSNERNSARNQRSAGAIYIHLQTPETSKEQIGEGDTARLRYKWIRPENQRYGPREKHSPTDQIDSDVVVTTYSAWTEVTQAVGYRVFYLWLPNRGGPEVEEKRNEIVAAKTNGISLEETIYDFVSEKIRTVELPLGSTGFRIRPPSETLSSGYGTPEDKTALLGALLRRSETSYSLLPSPATLPMLQLPRPSVFSQILLQIGAESHAVYLDPSLEVAPFGVIRSDARGKSAMTIDLTSFTVLQTPGSTLPTVWRQIPQDLPFRSIQQVNIDASLETDGRLAAKVHYAMRGDNELLLRVAFHQSPKEKWKELAQLLSITDGFRGQVTSVDASDPYATKEPFSLEYEIEQPKFVNWSKKTVRIPALLPQIGLPEPPAKPAVGAAAPAIDLGTPLEVETQMTLRLPAGTVVHTPTGTSVQRDYATYASQYGAKGTTITASRHIQFLLREIPATRTVDYNAFLRAVQNDEAQDFTLEPAAKQAEVKTQPPNNTQQPKL